jgi:hypothetical protein
MMSTLQVSQLQHALARFLDTTPYHPCCLIICPDVRRLAYAAEQIQYWYSWPTLSVGVSLSTALLRILPSLRPAEAVDVFTTAVRRHGAGPLVCSDIDLLFEPTLQLDPLRLLRDASRQVKLVVFWAGMVTNGRLSYAAPEHGHYRVWGAGELPTEQMIVL